MEEKLRQSEINLVKVVLFGPESTGKTTLSRQLARHYNTVWAPEYAREYLQDKWNNERKTCEESDLIPIAIGQMDLENSLAKKADKLLICDTDLLETKVYSEEYYGGFVDPLLDKFATKNTYDIYFLTYIDTPWEEDDLRDRPEQREEMFNAFKNTLEKYNRPYVLLKGDKETRLKKATQIIDDLISKKENLYSYSDTLVDLDLHFLHQNIDPNTLMH
jgi:HTH-type transcriptional repressor of NAD biosynthesis genes